MTLRSFLPGKEDEEKKKKEEEKNESQSVCSFLSLSPLPFLK